MNKLSFGIALSLALLLKGFIANAQDKPYFQKKEKKEERFIDRLVFGGNLGASFGSYTYVELSPKVGYRFTDKLTAGVGGTYLYISFNDPVWGGKYQSSIYGGSLFGIYSLTENFFAQGETELLNVKTFDNFENVYRRRWVPGIFVGGGLQTSMGGKSYARIAFLYNLTYDQALSPYANPFVIRIGFFL